MSKSASWFVVGLLTGALLASATFAWLGRGAGTSGPSARRLRVAHALPTSHPVHQAIEFMARRAEELSRGRLQLEIFPGEQLGTETQCLEQAQAGTLDITKVSSGAIGNFVPTYHIFGLPYLFRDESHFWEVLNGRIGRELLEALSEGESGRSSRLTGLCFYDAGSRNFYAIEPIRSPSDLEGKKIRVMNDQVAMDIVEALGGAPTPIPWGELYTALQQGVVDGAENNPPSLLASRHYEVCSYFTLNHHTRLPDVLVISTRVWDRLAEEEKEWLRQAADESTAFQRELWTERSDQALEELQAAGVRILEVDPEPFRRATRSVREKYGRGGLAGWVQRIAAEGGERRE